MKYLTNICDIIDNVDRQLSTLEGYLVFEIRTNIRISKKGALNERVRKSIDYD